MLHEQELLQLCPTLHTMLTSTKLSDMPAEYWTDALMLNDGYSIAPLLQTTAPETLHSPYEGVAGRMLEQSPRQPLHPDFATQSPHNFNQGFVNSLQLAGSDTEQQYSQQYSNHPGIPQQAEMTGLAGPEARESTNGFSSPSEPTDWIVQSADNVPSSSLDMNGVVDWDEHAYEHRGLLVPHLVSGLPVTDADTRSETGGGHIVVQVCCIVVPISHPSCEKGRGRPVFLYTMPWQHEVMHMVLLLDLLHHLCLCFIVTSMSLLLLLQYVFL